MNTHSRYNKARKILIFWCLFIGIGAVAGSVGMLTAPDGSNLGMESMLPYFQVLPFADILFQNYVFPGIALLCVNGITNLIAAFLLLRKRYIGIILGGLFGLTLMLWITIQFVIFPLNFMSTIYFIFGLLQAITGYAAWVFYRQENFRVDMSDYSNIGNNKDMLVVYFSRMGYTRKKALEEANATGADIYEVKSTELTAGTRGFWWCGRYGMHRWKMPIEQINVDLSAYSLVTICTPVWVFHLSPPMKSFCKMASGRITKARYIITHYNSFDYPSVADEMNKLLGIEAERTTSLCVRQGHIKSEHIIKEQ